MVHATATARSRKRSFMSGRSAGRLCVYQYVRPNQSVHLRLQWWLFVFVVGACVVVWLVSLCRLLLLLLLLSSCCAALFIHNNRIVPHRITWNGVKCGENDEETKYKRCFVAVRNLYFSVSIFNSWATVVTSLASFSQSSFSHSCL